MLYFNSCCNYIFFFYLENIYRMAKPDFLPTDQDILHIYAPTKGIYEYTYETNFCIEEIIFNIIDVGGNKDERKKWIYCLDKCIQAVLFVASLSEFDEFSSGCDSVSFKI